MPAIIGQGQSDATEAKERGLGAAFAVNLRIFKAKFEHLQRAVYFHFDLNCGSGQNEDVGCIGSPLAFLHAAQRIGEGRYFAGFVDRDVSAVKRLLARQDIAGDTRCFVFHGDNREFIDTIPAIIQARGERLPFAIGSVLCDPNGADIPIEKLAGLALLCPRLDFFINWNSAGYKRQRGSKGTLREAIDAIAKQHWLIRAPLSIHQFTLLLGRNVPVGDHRAEGFHHLHESHGQAILDRCHYTRAELAVQAKHGQAKLFDG